MDIKEMRKMLKELDMHVPRSNADVIELYNKEFETNEVAEEVAPSSDSALSLVTQDNLYTYVGQGDTPPQVIKFMGKQVFTRGVETAVTDPAVLEKVKVNASFVKGKVDGETLYANDEIARKKAQEQRDEDLKTEIHMQRQNKG